MKINMFEILPLALLVGFFSTRALVCWERWLNRRRITQIRLHEIEHMGD